MCYKHIPKPLERFFVLFFYKSILFICSIEAQTQGMHFLG